jgi:hypothetical protein
MKPITPPGTDTELARRTTLEGAISVFQRWLSLHDPDYIDAVLATVAAHNLTGEPLWLMVVGGSSGGKTEVLPTPSSA